MIAVELTEEHLRSIELRELERVDLGDTLDKDTIDYFMSSQYKKAVMDGDEIVMALGGIMEGTYCRTWSLGSPKMLDKKISCMKHLMDAEAAFMLQYAPTLFYTYNLPAFTDALKYLKRIGYHEKGLRRGFEDDKERILLIKEPIYGK